MLKKSLITSPEVFAGQAGPSVRDAGVNLDQDEVGPDAELRRRRRRPESCRRASERRKSDENDVGVGDGGVAQTVAPNEAQRSWRLSFFPSFLVFFSFCD